MSRSGARAEAVDYEAQIRDFYQQHNPAKLAEVPALLRKYAGKHRKLLASLHKKYGTATPRQSAATAKTSPPSVCAKRRVVELDQAGKVPVDFGDGEDEEEHGSEASGSSSSTAPAAKKGRGDGEGDGSEVAGSGGGATAATTSSSGSRSTKKRPKATVFCCAKCGHDCMELTEPTRMGSLRRRTSDGSAVVPEATLLKSLRAVPGKVNEFRRVPSNPRVPGPSRTGLERQFTFLCTHCSAALGYRHKPLAVDADFCYVLRGSIVSSASETLAGAGTVGSGNSKLLGAAEECTNLVCHVTPGTQKACITAIDDNEEVSESNGHGMKRAARWLPWLWSQQRSLLVLRLAAHLSHALLFWHPVQVWVSVKENSHRGRAQAAFLALISVTLGVRIGKLRIQEVGSSALVHTHICSRCLELACLRPTCACAGMCV